MMVDPIKQKINNNKLKRFSLSLTIKNCHGSIRNDKTTISGKQQTKKQRDWCALQKIKYLTDGEDTSSYSFESISGRDTIKAAKHLAAALRTFQLASSSSVYSFALSLQLDIVFQA